MWLLIIHSLIYVVNVFLSKLALNTQKMDQTMKVFRYYTRILSLEDELSKSYICVLKKTKTFPVTSSRCNTDVPTEVSRVKKLPEFASRKQPPSLQRYEITVDLETQLERPFSPTQRREWSPLLGPSGSPRGPRMALISSFQLGETLVTNINRKNEREGTEC